MAEHIDGGAVAQSDRSQRQPFHNNLRSEEILHSLSAGVSVNNAETMISEEAD